VSTSQLPRAGDRLAREGGNPFASTLRYKGETNLRNLDSPAIHRRETLVMRKEEEPKSESQAQSMTGTDNARPTRNILLNNREERIDKSNSDQPAFLRKVMD
jgi:cell division protein FtsZ